MTAHVDPAAQVEAHQFVALVEAAFNAQQVADLRSVGAQRRVEAEQTIKTIRDRGRWAAA